MTLSAGMRLGSYEILAPLGAGGMGEVYRARDPKLDREVAIKILPEAFSKDPERLARFEREARLLASLNHPNIAAIYGLENHEDLRFLVLELVPGETLAERIARGPIAAGEAVPLIIQVAEALEAAHEAGIIHRDLKPANIKVTPKDKVKVLDFGLAKALRTEPTDEPTDLSQSPTMTRGTVAGVILGTAPYMSPEQARGKVVDKRTDIWALGCCLYEVLTGRPPFEGDTVQDTLAAILSREPDWEELGDKAPRDLQAVLRRCLRKETSRRFHDVADARIELEEAMAGPDMIEVSSPARRSSWRWPLALLAVGVALGGLAVWSLTRSTAPADEASTRFVVRLSENQELDEKSLNPIAYSPDGTRIVYVASEGDGKQRLYIRKKNEFVSRAVPGTEGAVSPFFSPDSQWLAFFSEGELRKVPLAGGPPQTICAIASIDRPSAHWGPNDTIVFTFGINVGGSLMAVSANGGTPEQLTRAGSESKGWQGAPQVLPDGEHVLYTAATSDGLRAALLSFATGESKVLAELGEAAGARYFSTGHLVYGQSGSLMAVSFDASERKTRGVPQPIEEGVHTSRPGLPYFAGSDDSLVYVPGGVEDTKLVWVDRQGRQEVLIEDRGNFQHPSLSPDGKRLAFDIDFGGDRNVFIYDIERGTRTRFTFDGTSMGPRWTPDGSRIVFASNRSGLGLFEMFWKPADGSGDAEPLSTGESHYTGFGFWSPDGKMLSLTEDNPLKGRDILVMNLDTRVATPWVATSFNEGWPAFSPDGRFVAYVSDESGRNEIYVRPYPGPGGRWTISTNGGLEPLWSANGRELFYRNGDKMLVVDVTTDPDFIAGAPRLLFQGRYDLSPDGDQHYDVSPDSKRFVMVSLGEEPLPRELRVVLNWAEELKRMVPTK